MGDPSLPLRRPDAPVPLRAVPGPDAGPATPAVAVDDATLVARARAGNARAMHLLYDRHAPHVARVLTRILGTIPDVADLLHDAFRAALEQLASLDDPRLFRAWITRIAVFQARGLIRRRARWRWLRVLSGEDPLEEPVHVAPPDDVAEALGAVYSILARLPAEERIAFALRRLDGMSLGEVAAASGVSLATVKRRIARAEAAFRAEARRHPSLEEWIADNVEGGLECAP